MTQLATKMRQESPKVMIFPSSSCSTNNSLTDWGQALSGNIQSLYAMEGLEKVSHLNMLSSKTLTSPLQLVTCIAQIKGNEGVL